MQATGLSVVEHTSRTGCVRLRYDRFKKLHGIIGVLSIDKLLAGGKKEGLIWTAWRNRTHVQISDSYTAQLDRSPVRYHGAQYCPPRLLGRFVSYNYRVHHSDPELKSPLDRATTGG